MTEANETDEADATEVCNEPNEANCFIETIEACPLEYFLPIKSSEWDFGICVDRSGRNNQLGSRHNNQLGSSCNNQLGLDFKAIGVADMANELDELDGHVVVICRLRLDDAITITLYSLTKYSAIAAEVKEYFGISAPNNQHGQRSLCSLRSQNGTCCIENVFLS